MAIYMTLNDASRGRRIDGSPNFRRLPLTLILGSSGKSILEASIPLLECVNDGKMVCGRYDFTLSPFLTFLPHEPSGMPTVQGCGLDQ